MHSFPKFHWPCRPQVVLTILLLCLAGSYGQAQPQPIERVWSRSYSMKSKSVMANGNGWWIMGGEQDERRDPFYPLLLHRQAASDTFIRINTSSFNGGQFSSLQKKPGGQILVSTHNKSKCGMPVMGSLTNKAFISSDSSSTQWQFSLVGENLRESYTFPSDSSLIIADSLYGLTLNGQPFLTTSHNMESPVYHVSYQQEQVAFIFQGGIALYNEEGTQLHKNTSFNPIDATHWQGDTIAATDGENFYYLNDSLNIIAQKSLISNFATAPVLTTWQDRLILAGLNPQKTEWQVKSLAISQQMSDLVAFGDSSWVVKDMYVRDSVLGMTGLQQKRNSNVLLFKTIHLPDTAQDRSVDIALTDSYTENLSFEQTPGPNIYNVLYDLYATVRNNSTKDTIHRLSTYYRIDDSRMCRDNHYHQVHDSMTLLPGDSTTLQIGNITDFHEKDSFQSEVCPYVMAPNQAPDPDMSNNSYCDTLTAVGIETPSPSGNLRIYPTYVQDKLMVETYEIVDRATIRIHDIQGRLIHRSTMTGNRQTIRLNKQPAGIYVATVTTPNGTLSRKFVISN